MISGVTNNGVEVSHGDPNVGFPAGNEVIGNFVGTDVTGELAPAYATNGNHGVHLEDGARSNVVRDNVIGNNRRGSSFLCAFFYVPVATPASQPTFDGAAYQERIAGRLA